MNKESFLNILIAERDYHASHANETNVKFWYSLGGTMTSLVVGLAFQDKIPGLKMVLQQHGPMFIWSIILVVVGYLFIVWGLTEHSKIHKAQVKRLEGAIEYIVDPDNAKETSDGWDYKDFWTKYGKTELDTNLFDTKVGLLIKEPDKRKWGFHDNKIGIGFVFIIAGVSVLIVALLLISQ